jgi:beta-alanine degradation protein BauB
MFLANSCLAQTSAESTQRSAQFSNAKVNTWKTIIYPHLKHILPMHRHEFDRVVVALNTGTLKITNDRGQTHYLNLQKGKSYFLPKDKPNQLHTDQNISSLPIKVIVVELKY